MSLPNLSKSKTNGRWKREEHEKFVLGLLVFNVRASPLWEKLEENIGFDCNSQRLSNQVACSEIFYQIERQGFEPRLKRREFGPPG